MAGPVVIHQSFSTFGDGEYAVDAGVVRRIREEFDRLFCPLFRLQVWRWPDGSTKKFKNFGVGASSLEDIPIVGAIYAASRPTYGYLSKLEPAKDIVVWWPFENNLDGTPGHVIPFSDNIYYLVKRTFERTKELEYNAEQIRKTMALTFASQLNLEDKQERDKIFNHEKAEAAYRLKQEIPRIRKAMDETTQEDVEKFNDSLSRKANPFVDLRSK